jgi:TRAP transporter TAXI family solute receptor
MKIRGLMIRKVLSLCLSVALMSLAVAGTAAAQGKIKAPSLVFASGSVGGSWHPIAAAIVEKVHEHMVGRPISVRPGADAVGNPMVVGRGIADFGISYQPFLGMATRGEGPYKRKYNKLRAIFGVVPNIEHFFVDPDLGVDFLDEIFERKLKVRIGTGSPTSGDRYIMEQVLSLHGLTFKDTEAWGVKWELSGTGHRVNTWKDRHIDVFSSFIAVPASGIVQATHSRKGKWVPLKPETRKFLAEKFGLVNAVIPAGTYTGLSKDYPTVKSPLVIFTQKDIPDDIIYTFTKAAAENKDYVSTATATMKRWEPTEMWKGLGIETHPGALRYFKERGWVK